MDNIKIINEIAEEFSKLNFVDAVVLSGSQTGLIHDELSDFDIYIYSSKPVPNDYRQQLAEKFSDSFEVGNTFFEDGDELKIYYENNKILNNLNSKINIDYAHEQTEIMKNNNSQDKINFFGVDIMYRNLD